jgi:hypothetical protein
MARVELSDLDDVLRKRLTARYLVALKDVKRNRNGHHSLQNVKSEMENERVPGLINKPLFEIRDSRPT